jgi:hypothetical protein
MRLGMDPVSNATLQGFNVTFRNHCRTSVDAHEVCYTGNSQNPDSIFRRYPDKHIPWE